QKALAEGADEARLSKELATIVCDVPDVTLDLESAVLSEFDRDTVVELFRQLEFRTLIDRLPASTYIAPSRGAAAEPVAAPLDGVHEVVTTEAGLREVVEAVRQTGTFGFEIVADDEHPVRAADCLVGVAISPEAGRAWYIPFGHQTAEQAAGQARMDVDGEGAPGIEQLPRATVLEALAPLFTDPDIHRVAHNAKHGLLALAEADEH